MTSEYSEHKDLFALFDALEAGELDDKARAALEKRLQSDAEARRLYLDYMNVDALLRESFAGVPVNLLACKDSVRSSNPKLLRISKPWLAAAACLFISVSAWWLVRLGSVPSDHRPADHRPVRQVAVLAPGWEGHFSDASYEITTDGVVRLEQGEMFIRSVPVDPAGAPRMPLKVETPYGTATATGTEFYVGTHREKEEEEMKSLTRVLILSGIVTLTNGLGTVSGAPNDLLVAESERAPVKLALTANAGFAVDLYKQLAQEEAGKNLFFSPYSISSALAMVTEGARGETAEQMGKVLRYPAAARRVGDKSQEIPWRTSMIHSGMADANRVINQSMSPETLAARAKIAQLSEERRKLLAQFDRLRKDGKKGSPEWKEASNAYGPIHRTISKLKQETPTYEARLVNALWGEEAYPFDEAYVEILNKYHNTGAVRGADFMNNSAAARRAINDWAAKQTNNKIEEILPPDTVDENTRLVVASALYFHALWEEPFYTEDTKELDFTLGDGRKVKTEIMAKRDHSAAYYAAFDSDGKSVSRANQDAGGFAMIELPYDGEKFGMLVIAPNDPKGLPALEKRLTSQDLSDWTDQLRERKAHVYLPKFEMQGFYALGDSETPGALQKMGMVRAFRDPGHPNGGAQFQGMTSSTDPDRQLYLQMVLHKAVVDVNEVGTTAAAATAVSGALSESDATDVPEFRADRPFIFVIRERENGTVLFLGRVTDPRPSSDVR